MRLANHRIWIVASWALALLSVGPASAQTARPTPAAPPSRDEAPQGTLPELQVPSGEAPALPPGILDSPIEEIRGRPDGPPPWPDPAVTDPWSEPDADWQGLDDLASPNSLSQYGDLFDGGNRSGLSLLDESSHRSVIGRQELMERSPADMFQAIEREVGVMVQRTARGQASPFIRGLTGQQVLILVDGIRLNNATFRQGPNQYFNTIDPGMVERIEVLRGPQTVLYGADAIGGAINIVTRSAAGRFCCSGVGGQWTHRFNTADTAYSTRLNIEGSYGATSFFGGAGYANFNDLDRGGSLGRQPWTDYSQSSGDIKFDFLVDSSTMLTVALQRFVQEDLARSDRFPSRLTVQDPQDRAMAYLRLQGFDVESFFDSYTFTASYHRQREQSQDRRLSTNDLDFSELDDTTFGLSLVLANDLAGLGRLVYGADVYLDSIAASKTRFNATTGLPTEQLTPTVPDDGMYSQAGVFLQWDAQVTPRLGAEAGVRYTHVYASATPILAVDDDGIPGTPPVDTPFQIGPTFDDWSASAGLNYKLTDRLRLTGAISEGFRAPNLDDLAATNTNVQQSAVDTPSVDLLPERSVSYDIGLKADSPWLRGQIYYFWMDIDNMILREPAGDGGETVFSRSNRDSQVNGLELAGEMPFCNGWTAYGNLSYYLGEDRVRDEPLSRIPPTQGVIGARWRRDQPCDSYFDIYAWLVDRQDRLNFQDLTDSRIPAGGTPGFATLNFRCGCRLTPHQRIALNVENVFDKAYRVHGSGVDGSGASAAVTYELQW